MAQEVKYLSYSGLSHFKHRVFEVINPLISENKANILSIQNFLENPVFEVVNTNTLNVISEINLNGTRLFNFDFLPLSGGTMTGTINSQSIIPAKTHTTSDTAYSLGSSSKQFNTTYTRYIDTVSGFNLRLRSGGVEHLNMISGNVNSTANIIPTANNTYNLGSSALQWNNIYGKTLYENGTSLANKYAAASHTHTKSEITDFPVIMEGKNGVSYDLNTNFTTSNVPYICRLGSSNPNLPDGCSYGNLVHFTGTTSDTAFELLGDYLNTKLLFRSGNWKADGTGTIYQKSWKQIAFTSDIPTSLTTTEIDSIFNELGVTF